MALGGRGDVRCRVVTVREKFLTQFGDGGESACLRVPERLAFGPRAPYPAAELPGQGDTPEDQGRAAEQPRGQLGDELFHRLGLWPAKRVLGQQFVGA